MKVSALIAFCAAAAIAPEVQLREVDLELVLAVDVSRSMNAAESAPQRKSYVQTLLDPAFGRAIEAGPPARLPSANWNGGDRPAEGDD
jgi:Protein of unknown function (DUF1194)